MRCLTTTIWHFTSLPPLPYGIGEAQEDSIANVPRTDVNGGQWLQCDEDIDISAGKINDEALGFITLPVDLNK